MEAYKKIILIIELYWQIQKIIGYLGHKAIFALMNICNKNYFNMK